MSKEFIELKNKTIFITGVAGFIGSNLAERLLKEIEGIKIVGLDNMNDYYDVRLKEYRLEKLSSSKTFSFVKGNLADKELINSIFEKYTPQVVVNLGAQAGVRYSITNPDAYIEGNLIGFYNILEGCRHYPVEHLVYASSSSVYGSNKKVPYSTEDKVDNPVSLYAATKKSNELMAHAYSKLYNIPSTGLRFFTVYGPAGRPDMAYFGFTNKLLNGETIKIFNYGNCKRDFTYVDDIVEGVVRVMQGAPEKKNGEDGLPIPPYAVYNIGNNHPENLLDFVQILQEELIRAKVLPEDYDFEAHKELVPMQPGDVPVTYADTQALERDYGFKPSTTLREGKTSTIRVGSTERRRTKKHQQFITENHHKGIVTHEEFEDAQSVIGKQKERGFVQDSGFSLKGKVTCGNCKLKMMYNYGAVPVVYCAHTSAAGKMSTCDKTRHKVKKIERIVLNALRRQLEIFKQLAKKLEEEQKNKQTDLPAIQKEMEKQLETLREERIRQYEAYAEGMTDRECYLKVKKELNQKIDKIQEKYERLLTITTEDGELMKEIQVVKQEAEQAEVFDKMTRHIAETFIDEVIIYDAEKIEIRFLFDDLIAEMTEKIEREEKEDVAV